MDVESRDSESRIERGKEKRMVWFLVWLVLGPAGGKTNDGGAGFSVGETSDWA